MPLNLSLSLDGDVQLNRTLLGITERGTDFRPFWHHATDRLLDWEQRQFDSEGAFGGSRWLGLAQRTQDERKELGIGPRRPILNRTGAGHYQDRVGGQLMRTLTVRGAANQVLVIEPGNFAFGTTDEVAGYHQHGTARMPARKPLNLPGAARQWLVKGAQRWWVRGELA